jgi:hypothetical protein
MEVPWVGGAQPQYQRSTRGAGVPGWQMPLVGFDGAWHFRAWRILYGFIKETVFLLSIKQRL